jgi:hypothetical protein
MSHWKGMIYVRENARLLTVEMLFKRTTHELRAAQVSLYSIDELLGDANVHARTSHARLTEQTTTDRAEENDVEIRIGRQTSHREGQYLSNQVDLMILSHRTAAVDEKDPLVHPLLVQDHARVVVERCDDGHGRTRFHGDERMRSSIDQPHVQKNIPMQIDALLSVRDDVRIANGQVDVHSMRWGLDASNAWLAKRSEDLLDTTPELERVDIDEPLSRLSWWRRHLWQHESDDRVADEVQFDRVRDRHLATAPGR